MIRFLSSFVKLLDLQTLQSKLRFSKMPISYLSFLFNLPNTMVGTIMWEVYF